MKKSNTSIIALLVVILSCSLLGVNAQTPTGEAPIRERVQQKKEEVTQKRESIKKEIEEKKGEFQKKKEEVRSTIDQKRIEGEQKRTERKTEIESIKKETLEKRKTFVSNGFTQMLVNLNTRSSQLERAITQATAAGIVTQEAQAGLVEARTHIAKAEAALGTLRTLDTQTESSRTTIRTQAQAVQSHIQQARATLIKAAQTLRKAVSAHTNSQQ